MFFIRYSWTLPLRAQFAVCIALIVVVLGAHSPNSRAEAFAALHQSRCMQQRGAPVPTQCTMRTIQLAAQMHGEKFGWQVAEALR